MRTREYLMKYAYVYCYVLSLILALAAMVRYSIEVVGTDQALSSTMRIVIDAGHGGIDGGTTSVSGVLEKNLNLQIAKRLEKLLILLGASTEMTRTTPDSVATEGETIREQKRSDLRNRLTIINRVPNTLLVSIHQNHYPNSKYTGPQIFHADDEKSKTFAKNLQQTMNAVLKTKRECKKTSGVYLMSNLKCPGILVECGFLSNAQEDVKLQTPDYQKRICCLLASALMGYVKQEGI